MPIYLLNHFFYFDIFRIDLHFHAIFCEHAARSVIIHSAILPNDSIRAEEKNILNFRSNTGFSVLSLGSCVTEIFMICRALGGRIARNIRAVFARCEKGLNFIVTSERNRGIIVALSDKSGDAANH
jgi:hypothetical protein